MLFYIIGSVWCAFATDITMLIGGRVIQALEASAGAVIGNAIARDLWSGKALADRLSALVLVIGVAPILAPSLGSVLLWYWDWHGMFWFLGGVALLVGVGVMFLPETAPPQMRATMHMRAVGQMYAIHVGNRPFMGYVLVAACGVGMLLAYITSSAFMYMTVFGVSAQTFAVLFGVNALGFVLAAQVNRVLLRHVRLITLASGAVLLALVCAVSLLAVAWLGWSSVALYTGLFFSLSAAIGCMFPNLAALAFGHVQEHAGSAAALQGIAQSVVGGLAGGLVGWLSNGTMIPAFAVIVGFAGMAAGLLRLVRRADVHNVMSDAKASASDNM